MPHRAPLGLVILDGWGVADASGGNAIALAQKPHFDLFERQYPCAKLAAAGIDVGLMWGVVGNSETGHLNIGSGRIVYQHLPRILFAIRDGSFSKNQALLGATDWTARHGSTLHLAGLLSSGTVHSYIDNLYALLDLAHQHRVPRVMLHIWLDGRDSYIREGVKAVANLQLRLSALHLGQISSVMGRSFAMDRNENWTQTQRAYDCMVRGEGRKVTDLSAYLQASYALGLTDEFIEPAVVVNAAGNPVGPIRSNDAVVTFNFRADRVRQITQALTSPAFAHFPRELIANLHVVTMTEYEPALPVTVAFPQENVTETLTEVISRAELRQLHIAETEKYAHVTYFFNGRREPPFPGEDRVLIPSQHHGNFDAMPEMQAPEIAARVVAAVQRGRYDAYVINFANADMLGHTGNLKATVTAVEEVDHAVGSIVNAMLQRNGTILITGDHGNAERMIEPTTDVPLREHSLNPVPFYLINHRYVRGTNAQPLHEQQAVAGRLSDVAPTVLEILGLPVPKAMTGKSLLPKFRNGNSRPKQE